jgi:hypothetical protein
MKHPQDSFLDTPSSALHTENFEKPAYCVQNPSRPWAARQLSAGNETKCFHASKKKKISLFLKYRAKQTLTEAQKGMDR